MGNDCDYVLSFNSTSHAIAAEKKLMRHFNITVIPTPRAITENCGISIKINEKDAEKIISGVKALAIPCVLYRLRKEEKKISGIEKLLIVG